MTRLRVAKRLLLVILLAAGVAAMHTLGHLDEDMLAATGLPHTGEAMVSAASAPLGPHAFLPAALGVAEAASVAGHLPVVDRAPWMPGHGMDPGNMCLAILILAGLILLVWRLMTALLLPWPTTPTEYQTSPSKP
jgi:hypothetical protein